MSRSPMTGPNEAETLPEPLVTADVDCRGLAFMPLDVQRLRDSDLACEPDSEVFRANVMSWCVAWHQTPAGSLPDDDATLARLLGYGRDLKTWKRVRSAGGLRGWVLCRDGRLYHPVVAEKAMEAWQRRQAFRDRTRKARSKRLSQTPQQNQSQGPPQRQSQSLLQNQKPSVTETTGTGTGTGTGTKIESDSPRPVPDAAREDWLALGARCCGVAGLDESRIAVDFGIVAAWLREGFDPDRDIIPAITAAAMKRQGNPVTSLKYFTNAIRRWRDERLNGNGSGPNGGDKAEPLSPDGELMMRAAANFKIDRELVKAFIGAMKASDAVEVARLRPKVQAALEQVQ